MRSARHHPTSDIERTFFTTKSSLHPNQIIKSVNNAFRNIVGHPSLHCMVVYKVFLFDFSSEVPELKCKLIQIRMQGKREYGGVATSGDSLG